MKSENQSRYENALNAIAYLYLDTTISQSETKDKLLTLISEIEIMINSLTSDETINKSMTGDN
ncbi:MAG: hypothetical protein WA061_02715 [Microgenomates group bacterium]